MSSEILAYAGMFVTAFLAATILPAQSETALVLLILTGKYPLAALVGVASLGNILGSATNWLLGRSVERFRHRRWFPVSHEKLLAAEKWYRRYGKWSLLASWLPIVGDPLTIVAGILKVPFITFILLVTVAKTGRYLVLAGLTMGWM